MLSRLHDGRVEVLCSRCLMSAIAESAEALAELGWELRDDGQTWCLACSAGARTPKGRPNARGIVRRR